MRCQTNRHICVQWDAVFSLGFIWKAWEGVKVACFKRVESTQFPLTVASWY